MDVKRKSLLLFQVHGYPVGWTKLLGWHCDCQDWIQKMTAYRKNKMPKKGKVQYPSCKHVDKIRNEYPDVYDQAKQLFEEAMKERERLRQKKKKN